MVKVYAPASIGNIIVGFDVLGTAIIPDDNKLLGDSISIETSTHFNLNNIGHFADELPKKVNENIVYLCWQHFCKKIGKQYPVTIVLEKNVPISSGLGSSACSIVASLVAMNTYCHYPLNNNQILKLMGEMEGLISGGVHFDNVIPCFLGGVRLIIINDNIIINQLIPSFLTWRWIIAYPGVKISTSISRSILPEYYSRQDCINHSQYLAGFIHACHTQQSQLAAQLMKDVITEPYRIQLIPDLIDIRQSLINIGALACGISGSGPTIFAICDNDKISELVADWLSNNFIKNKKGFVYICHVDTHGTYITK